MLIEQICRLREKSRKSSQAEGPSTSTSPAARPRRSGSTDMCSRAYSARVRAHIGPHHRRNCPTSPDRQPFILFAVRSHPATGRSPSPHNIDTVPVPYARPPKRPTVCPDRRAPQKRKQPRRQRSCSPYDLSENDGKRGDPATVRSVDDPVPIRPTAPIGSLTSGTGNCGG